MCIDKNQSNVHFCVGVIIIYALPKRAARPSLTLTYNDVVVLELPENYMPHLLFGQWVQSKSGYSIKISRVSLVDK